MEQNSIYFHTGDHIPQNVFTTFPCEYMRVYVQGLEKNGVYLEDSRGLLVYEDGEIFLAKDNTDFKIYSLSDNTYIDSMKIKWKDDCELVTHPYLEDISDTPVVQEPSITTTTGNITTTSKTTIPFTSTSYLSLEEMIPESFLDEDITSHTEVAQESEIIHQYISSSNDTESGSMRFFDAFFPILVLCLIFGLVYMKGSE